MKKKEYSWIIFFVIAVLATFITVITGNFFTQKVSLEIGEIAKETLYAPFQVENEEATNRLRLEAEASVETVYKIDSTVQEKAIGNIEKLFVSITSIQESDVADTLERTPVEVLSGRSPIGLYNEQYATLLEASSEELYYMKEVCIQVAGAIFAEGISPKENNKTIEVRSAIEETDLSVAMKKIAQDIIMTVLEPNVVEDEAATNELKKIARDKVDPVYVLAQEKIVEKGAKVSEESYKLLEKVGYLDTNKLQRYLQYAGIIMMIMMMSFLCYRYMASGNHVVLKKRKQLSLVLILYTLAILLTRLMVNLSFVYLPLGIPCMVIAFALGPSLACFIHIVIIIFSAAIFKGDIIFIIYFIVMGIASILIVSRMQERTRTMMNGLYVGLIQMCTFVALKLFTGSAINIMLLYQALIALMIGIISVIVVVGGLPTFEALFGFVTPMQLLELTNPNQPVLKRLLLEATGTYYHSLLVANLAESAASVVGANSLLARVGGYYHDIGKLTCSKYFKENQGSNNPHDYMTPEESYQVIVSHVTSGVSLVEQYHLPIYIKDIILQHHGTSTMQYFYVKAQEESNETIYEKDFKYPGPKPKTKEAALVMLADVVEAAVRSMEDKLGKECAIETIVRKMIKQKLEEGQLDECPLYISDMDKIVACFTKMLTGMYHQRIAYPERKDK